MIIIVGNQKGGVGKSTLALLIASKVAEEKKVVCYDFDPQLTLYNQYIEECNLYDEEPPFKVIAEKLYNSETVINELIKDKDTYYIIDLPGHIANDDLIYIYKNSDVIICPYHYDLKTMESTITFLQIVRDFFKLTIPVLMIPNLVKSTVKYENKEEILNVLSEFGINFPEIKHTVNLQKENIFAKNNNYIEKLNENDGVLGKIYEFLINLN